MYWEISLLFLIGFTLISFNKAKSCISFIFILSFISGCFRRYGADFETYKEILESFSLLSHYFFIDFSLEPFWYCFGFLLQNVDFTIKLGIVFSLSYTLRYIAIIFFFKSTANRIIAFLFYICIDLFNRDLGQIRNGLAASILCLIMVIIYKKKTHKTYPLYLLGLFHYSYLIFPILFHLSKKIRSKVIVFSCLLLSLISSYLIDFSIFKNIDYLFFAKLSIYSTPDSSYVVFKKYPASLYLVIFYSLLYFFINDTSKRKIGNTFLVLNTVYLCMYIAFSFSPIISSRILTIFTPLLMFYTPFFIKNIPLQVSFKNKFALLSILLLFNYFFVQLIQYNNIYKS